MKPREQITVNPRVTRRIDLERERNIRLNGLDEPAPDGHGIFTMRAYSGRELYIIMSADFGWDHVSISLPDRCPSWAEMDTAKRAFFRDDEVAMQLHVAGKDHINVHPHCLHLWRPHDGDIPLPPKDFV